MKQDCIFCKIANKEIKSDFLYETDKFFAIKDIHPKAKTHLLLIPKEHIETLNDLKDRELAADLICAIQDVTKKNSIKDYKVQINTGAGAGQEVFHLHVHILSNNAL